MNLGAPLNPAGTGQTTTLNTFVWQGQTLYFRRFKNGYVLVNPNDAVLTNIPLNDPGLFGAAVRRITRSNLSTSLASIPTSTTITLSRCRGAIFRTTLTAAPPPTNLTATAVSATQVNLAWPDIANETLYRIQRKTGAGAFGDLTTKSANSISHSDTTVVANTNYTYQIRAENSAGNSGWTVSNSVTTPAATPTLNENFNDGVANGWSVVSGTWAVNGSFKYEQKQAPPQPRRSVSLTTHRGAQDTPTTRKSCLGARVPAINGGWSSTT